MSNMYEEFYDHLGTREKLRISLTSQVEERYIYIEHLLKILFHKRGRLT